MISENFRAMQISKLTEVKNKTEQLDYILNKEGLDCKDVIEFVNIHGKAISELQSIAKELLYVTMQ
ncbi:hypothetical protein [Metaclostridioides mangenotii]|uniref:hypothetical protein n=1 Tax=Metaclostridioides mangenotii TaxID=1540 RepID=UPI000464EFBE|nr:hypothetical protein [Clostridioides mangenotii]